MAVIKGINSKKKQVKKKFSKVDEEEIAHITISEHATVNLGDYESSKVSFGITLPTKIKDIDTTRDELEKYISDYINDRVKRIRGELYQ